MLIKGFEPLCIKQLILSQPCIPVPPYERIAVSEEPNLTVSLLNNPKTKSGSVSLPCLRLQHTIHISVLMIHECVLLYFHISFPPLQQMTNTRLELSIFALRGRCPNHQTNWPKCSQRDSNPYCLVRSQMVYPLTYRSKTGIAGIEPTS